MRRSLFVVVLVAACNPPAGDMSTTGGDADGGSSTGAADDDTAATDPALTSAAATTDADDTDAATGEPPAAVCPEGDVVLVDQDDVVRHAGCTDFPGDLTVRWEVTDLAPLAGVRRVAGKLTIGTIGNEGSLTTLDPLASLESVGGLDVAMVPIADLLAFSSLTEIPGDLEIFGLDFPSLEGLHNLTAVGGEVRIAISDVADLDGLRGLRRVGRGIYLSNLDITDLGGLGGLTELGEAGGEPAAFSLWNLPGVGSLADLSFPWHDAVDVSLHQTGLVDLVDLEGVAELHGLEIVDNDGLTALDGLESLVRVGGALKVQSNQALVDPGGLGGLESVGELVLIGDQFADLAAFASLRTIGSLVVRGFKGAELPPPPALEALGAASFLDCDELTGLTILGGVPELAALTLDRNDALVDLSALAGLVAVSGELAIRDNDALATVGELAALQTVGGRVVVVGNPSLPQAEAAAWGEGLDVGGARKIAGNKDAGRAARPVPVVRGRRVRRAERRRRHLRRGPRRPRLLPGLL